MEDEHLLTVLDTQRCMYPQVRDVMIRELELHRKINYVEEEKYEESES